MGRPKSTIRISLKGKSKSARLNIKPMIDGQFAVYRDGKFRGSMSATQIGKKISSWLRVQR